MRAVCVVDASVSILTIRVKSRDNRCHMSDLAMNVVTVNEFKKGDVLRSRNNGDCPGGDNNDVLSG